MTIPEGYGTVTPWIISRDTAKLIDFLKNAFNAVGIGPDVYLRDNVADTGAEPYPGGYLYASPDIINRTTPSLNPAVDFADVTNDALWQNVEFGQDNYIYVRLQNRGSANGDATINLYFSAASTFGTPASWIHIGSLSELGIAPGSVRIAGPLTFPSAMIPGVGHYCMIAVVSDALDPAPDYTLIASLSDYLNFVRNTNNIAYRNMDVVDMIPGTPGVLETEVRTLAGLREGFDLRIDVGRSPPGTMIRVRGPARALDGAIAHGLRLVARRDKQNVYDVLAGRERGRNLAFLGAVEPGRDVAPGFDNVLVERDFRLTVEYVLPGKELFHRLDRDIRRESFLLGVRQLWKGEVVGAVAIRSVPPTPREEPAKRRAEHRNGRRRHRA